MGREVPESSSQALQILDAFDREESLLTIFGLSVGDVSVAFTAREQRTGVFVCVSVLLRVDCLSCWITNSCKKVSEAREGEEERLSGLQGSIYGGLQKVRDD